MRQTLKAHCRMTGQRGLSLTGLMLALFLFGVGCLFAAKVVPTITEYMTIQRSIESAKASGGTVREIQNYFDRQSSVNGVTAIAGKDLEMRKNGEQLEISFAYQKKIRLFGPVSLLIDYAGSTEKNAEKNTKN